MAAAKAFVLALSQSPNHGLVDKGVRVQAVLPGVTATDFWSSAGLSVRNLPTEIVTSPEDVVDAALAGLDQGETVTIPSLLRRSAPRDVRQALEFRAGPPIQHQAFPISRSMT
jgi:hypothetical protein